MPIDGNKDICVPNIQQYEANFNARLWFYPFSCILQGREITTCWFFFFSFIHPAADYWVFFCAQALEYKTQSLFSKSFATIQEELA